MGRVPVCCLIRLLEFCCKIVCPVGPVCDSSGVIDRNWSGSLAGECLADEFVGPAGEYLADEFDGPAGEYLAVEIGGPAGVSLCSVTVSFSPSPSNRSGSSAPAVAMSGGLCSVSPT